MNSSSSLLLLLEMNDASSEVGGVDMGVRMVVGSEVERRGTWFEQRAEGRRQREKHKERERADGSSLRFRRSNTTGRIWNSGFTIHRARSSTRRPHPEIYMI